jgi:hypothetical protein
MLVAAVELELLTHMTILPRLLTVSVLLVAAGCAAGNAYLPHKPGGAASDLSGPPDRQLWLDEHPDTSDEIQKAILEGIFIVGMTVEHRDVVSNSDRRGTTGYGYWRSRELDDQVRYQWFVASERQPFDDARGRAICELVYVDDLLADIRYCSSEPAGS